MIVTIDREFGSGGRELGKRLSDALGIPCYDDEIIEMVTKECKLDWYELQRQLAQVRAVAPRPLVLDGLILLLQGRRLFAGQNRFPVAQVVVRHSEDGFIIRHVADDTGHIFVPRQLACPLPPVARYDLIGRTI